MGEIALCEKCNKFLAIKSDKDGKELCAICYAGGPAYLPKIRKVGRNEKCHCGSDKKYKKCCFKK